MSRIEQLADGLYRVCGFGVCEPSTLIFGRRYGTCPLKQECHPDRLCGYLSVRRDFARWETADMNREREAVIIDYTNWRGERGLRRIIPLTVRFESTEWHPDEQWLLRAIDIEKGVELALAQRDVAIQALNQIAWMDEFLSADAAREMMTIARETLSQLCSPQERGGSDG